jgi:mRNA interferase YafQ
MILKKTAASKRTSLLRSSDYTKKFKKDWERLSRSGRYDLNRLKEVMLLLITNEGPLGQEWLDHPLSGNWEGYRECHVGGDFLLIYQLDDNDKSGMIIFVRTGTHAELFE